MQSALPCKALMSMNAKGAGRLFQCFRSSREAQMRIDTCLLWNCALSVLGRVAGKESRGFTVGEGTVWETWRVWFKFNEQRCDKLQDKGKHRVHSLKYCNWSVMMEGQMQF